MFLIENSGDIYCSKFHETNFYPNMNECTNRFIRRPKAIISGKILDFINLVNRFPTTPFVLGNLIANEQSYNILSMYSSKALT